MAATAGPAAPTAGSKPLAGVLVVGLEQAVAAPLATRHLADLGARVIKVERPDGGDFARAFDTSVRGMSSHFVWCNRSKESLCLDLSSSFGQEAIARLIARADVLVSNFRSGAVERLGLDAARLRARHPRLITCNISGYGPGGPDSERAAYDLLVQCETGLLEVTGTEAQPSKVGIAIADIATGMYAFSGILAALYRRQLTGEGASLEVAMLDSLAEWMGFPLYYTAHTGQPPPRSGSRHATIAPYGPFPTRDGSPIFLGVQNQRDWERLCDQVLGQPELAVDPRFVTNSRRLEHREELEAVVSKTFASLSETEATDRLEQARVAWARMRGVRGLIEHQQLRARDRWRQVDSPAGPLEALLPPIEWAGVGARMDPIPALGEHTAAILRELGYGDTEIAPVVPEP